MINNIDWFLYACLIPKHTGLPFNIWITPGADNQNPYILIQGNYSSQLKSEDLFTMNIEHDSNPTGNTGELSPQDICLVKKFITLNKQPLLDYWDETDPDIISIITRIRRAT